MEKRDLGFGHLGNGITVYDRLHEENGDYVTVAHISTDRQITWHMKRLEPEYRQQVEDFARYANPMRTACLGENPSPVLYGKPPEARV